MKTLRRHPPLTSSSPTLLAPMHGPATIVSNTNLLQASWQNNILQVLLAKKKYFYMAYFQTYK